MITTPSCDCHVILRKELGSLRLKVQCHEERILDAQFYTPFVEFMLNAVDEKKVWTMSYVRGFVQRKGAFLSDAPPPPPPPPQVNLNPS